MFNTFFNWEKIQYSSISLCIGVLGYRIIKISTTYDVLKISAFEFDAYHGFHADAGVVDGEYTDIFE